MSPTAENDATIRVSMTPQQWADQLAHAWDKGYEAGEDRGAEQVLTGERKRKPRNPYRVLPPGVGEWYDDHDAITGRVIPPGK